MLLREVSAGLIPKILPIYHLGQEQVFRGSAVFLSHTHRAGAMRAKSSLAAWEDWGLWGEHGRLVREELGPGTVTTSTDVPPKVSCRCKTL